MAARQVDYSENKTAQTLTMKDVYVARQPIYDPELNVVAYELLFREGEQSIRAEVKDEDQATDRVLVNTFADIGLKEVTGNKPAFVNLGRNMILRSMAPPFPKDRVVIELLEDQIIDDALIAGIKTLKDLGFTIALDDFFFEQSFAPLVELADIVKLDVLALSETELLEHVQRLKPYQVVLLAEKIEDHEMFSQCKNLGFELFQGYFFCKPKIIQGTRKHLQKEDLLALLRTMQAEISEAELIEFFETKTRFVYKLCRILNTLNLYPEETFYCIEDIIQNLGLTETKKWCHVIALYNVKNKPKELFVTAAERAYMCEAIAKELSLDNSAEFFICGLLSVADGIFDIPIAQLAQFLELNTELQQALTFYAGDKGDILHQCIHYEHGEFEAINTETTSLEILSETYIEALKFSETVTSALYSKKRESKF